MTRSVSNPTRGCGTLKQGGFYARGTSGPGGILLQWTWLLGHMWDGEGAKNLTWEVPPRAMQIINLPFSIYHETIVQDLDLVKLADTQPFTLPTLALADHVGSNHYTSWQFAQECQAHGPSRRIPRAIAAQIAQMTPIPIVFTHDWMPLSPGAGFIPLIEWTNDAALRYEGPTWEREGYGFTIRDTYDGSDHWVLPVLQAMHEQAGGHVKGLEKIMPVTLTEFIVTTEQALGVSWINEVQYIVEGNETDEELEQLTLDGIEPVQLEGDSND